MRLAARASLEPVRRSTTHTAIDDLKQDASAATSRFLATLSIGKLYGEPSSATTTASGPNSFLPFASRLTRP
jgi:hypothetical protein